jgi:3-hydroxy-9,10-secoandrosta-1,3,5(10)-triene-9,17-dione monooxygenase reductase component
MSNSGEARFTQETNQDSADFRQLAGQWPTSVSVVTTTNPAGRPFGLTVGAVASLSLNPRQFLVCIDNRSDSLQAMLETRRFCINLLACCQENISDRFAARSSDRFQGISHWRHASSLPILDGIVAFATCEVAGLFPGGDHQIVVGGLLDGKVYGGEPLLHFRRTYRALS